MKILTILFSSFLLAGCGKGISERIFGADTHGQGYQLPPNPGSTAWAHDPEFCSRYPDLCNEEQIKEQRGCLHGN